MLYHLDVEHGCHTSLGLAESYQMQENRAYTPVFILHLKLHQYYKMSNWYRNVRVLQKAYILVLLLASISFECCKMT